MNKLRWLFFSFSLILLLIIFKLFWIQVLASDQSFSNNDLKTIQWPPRRGALYDRQRRPLVVNQTTFLLYAEPKKIKEKSSALKKIDDVLHLGQATLEARINSEKNWIVLKNNLSKEQKKLISDLKIDGLGFEETSRRFYPEASLAAQLLGFVGKTTEGDDIGYFGVEGFYDKDLAGLPGLLKSERDLLGKPIFLGVQERIKGEQGRDLVLTIDNTVQLISKRKLQEGIERYGAKEGCVIIAEPQSLEILAFSCLPDFDPNEYFNFSNDFFANSAISKAFEPGSIFKPIIMASALNEKAVKPDDIYNETGPVTEGGYTINTWNDQYEGPISITRILEKSSNVGMVYVGDKLGHGKLRQYLELFGIGEKTGIDLQGEVTRKIKLKDRWYSIDYATATFGQGIVVTPIQILRAFSALVNGGYLMQPHVVKEMISETGQADSIAPKVQRKVISEKTSLQMKTMLQNTIEHAEARWNRPKGYKIGGKTGTAQIPVAGHYDPSKTVASFIGFAPVDKPKFIALVYLKEPSSSPWGSETAAPLFFEIVKELLVYYNIAPE